MPVDSGLPYATVTESHPAIAASGSTIIAGTGVLGIYRTTNLGTLWSQSNTGLRASQINGIFADAGMLYAASETNGFFRSANQGASWTEINTGIPNRTGWFSFGRKGTNLLGGCGTTKVYRSANDGTSWTQSSTGLNLTETHKFVNAGGDTVYAVGLAGINISTDGGMHWSFITAGISLGQTVLDLIKDGSYLMMGSDVGGCVRSTDDGQTWNATILGLPGTGAFSGFAKLDTLWFVATDHGVYRSYDHGNHWTKADTLFSGIPKAILAIDGSLYLGTTDGVWESFDSASSWTDIGSGFAPNTTVSNLATDGSYLYAGTNKFSVWQRSLIPTDVADGTGPLPSDFTLAQNYPNPFNPTTTIAFSLSRRGKVRLDVFNMLGQRVKTLVDEERAAGQYTIEWNGTDNGGHSVASGMYLYRLQTTDATVARKMVLVK